jgi:hypothetical protein
LIRLFPGAATFQGKERIPYFFEAIFQSVDVEAFEPDEWIADGDAIASLGEFECRVRAADKRTQVRETETLSSIMSNPLAVVRALLADDSNGATSLVRAAALNCMRKEVEIVNKLGLHARPASVRDQG